MTTLSATKWGRNRKRVYIDRSLVVGGKRCSSLVEIYAQLNVSIHVCCLDNCTKFLVVVDNEFHITNCNHEVEFP